jgi:DNA polymerase-3 subunit epsilon
MQQRTTFTAIDFETANRDPDSACAVGLVRVEQGRIVRREYRLIRPWTRRFEFTYLHGIAWRHVATAGRFADVWHVIAGMCRGVDFVAAHNAPFDEGVLRACCARSGITPDGLRFECTVRMARRALGIYPTGLAVVAKRLGLSLDHHDAASDAAACAQIVLRTARPRVPTRRRGSRSWMSATFAEQKWRPRSAACWRNASWWTGRRRRQRAGIAAR